MKKCLVVLAVVCLAIPAYSAGPIKLGMGVTGGLDIPLVQDDQGSGHYIGFRARVKLTPLFVAEPNIRFGGWGEPDLGLEGVTNDLDGADVTAYGVDVLIGAPWGLPKFSPFGIVGAAFYKVKQEQTGFDETNLGISGGLGVGIGLTPFLSGMFGGWYTLFRSKTVARKNL